MQARKKEKEEERERGREDLHKTLERAEDYSEITHGSK